MQNEIPPDSTLAAMKAAKAGSAQGGPLVILNAAPAPAVGNAWQEGQWREDQVANMLEACDILCINESEAKEISGVTIAGEHLFRILYPVTAACGLEMGCRVLVFGFLRGCLYFATNRES